MNWQRCGYGTFSAEAYREAAKEAQLNAQAWIEDTKILGTKKRSGR